MIEIVESEEQDLESINSIDIDSNASYWFILKQRSVKSFNNQLWYNQSYYQLFIRNFGNYVNSYKISFEDKQNLCEVLKYCGFSITKDTNNCTIYILAI